MKAFSSRAEGRKGKKLRMPVDDTAVMSNSAHSVLVEPVCV